MFNRKVPVLAALMVGIFIASGVQTMLAHPYGGACGPTLAQIDAFELMSKATALPEQIIENLI
jgi:hypothetical protein